MFELLGGIILGAMGAGTFYFMKNKNSKNVMLKALRELALEFDAKDPYFNGHSRRVALSSREVGRAIGLSSKRMFDLEVAVYFSELAKMRTPEDILTKREKLTDSEFEIVKKHTMIGFKMIEDIKEMKKVAEIVKSHHERYDGNGYPEGMLGESIPIEARIINITDAYDAMTSSRPYRKTLTESEAIEELQKGKEKQFDPKLVDAFVDVLKNKL